MTTPRATYGQFIDDATLRLAHALTEPINLAAPRDVLTLLQARTRLYRSLAGAITTHTFGENNGAAATAIRSLQDRERALVAQLHTDLTTTANATKATLGLDPATASGPAPAGTADHLRRAADAAGVAFDLLATHLDSDRLPRTPDGQRLRGGDAGRAAIADATMLARGAAELDQRTATTLHAATARITDPALRPVLTAAVADVERVARVGVAPFAHAVSAMLRTEHRAGVDELAPAATLGPSWTGIGSPADAAIALDALRSWTTQHDVELTVTDLMNIAAVGARLTRLTGFHHQQLDGDHTTTMAEATRSATAWRQAHMGLRELHTVHPAPPGATLPQQLAAWVDTHLRREAPGAGLATPRDPGRASEWHTSIQAITAYLPDLADAARRSLTELHENGRLIAANRALSGSGPLYTPVRLSDPRIPPIADALRIARDTSASLAVLVRDTSPRTHPRPDLVANAARVAHGFTGRTANVGTAAERQQAAPVPADRARRPQDVDRGEDRER